jgi:membrane-bound lytic murein transglycosylase
MKRLDQIIPLYDFYEYQHPADKKKEDIVKIIEQARNTILMKIPELKNVTYNKDHVIPDIIEDIYDLLVETHEEYIVEIEKVKSLTTLEILKIQLKIYDLKAEQMRLAQQHFKILREMSDAIRVQMSRRPRIDMTIYRNILEQIKEIKQRIEMEQNRLQRR